MRYLLLNKPYDVVSQFSGPARCLRHYVDVPNVYPVGRLDRDSEGLLLLTDDGWLQHKLSDPKFGHPRTYWVQVERVPSNDALTRLRNGLELDGAMTRPTEARLIAEPADLPPRDPPVRYRANVPTAWIELTLTEGRNRQVRRMTAAVGHPTLRLVRTAIGDLRAQGLPQGEWRKLTNAEFKRLMRPYQ